MVKTTVEAEEWLFGLVERKNKLMGVAEPSVVLTAWKHRWGLTQIAP